MGIVKYFLKLRRKRKVLNRMKKTPVNDEWVLKVSKMIRHTTQDPSLTMRYIKQFNTKNTK